MHDSPPPTIIQLREILVDMRKKNETYDLTVCIALVDWLIEFYPELTKDAKGQSYKE